MARSALSLVASLRKGHDLSCPYFFLSALRVCLLFLTVNCRSKIPTRSGPSTSLFALVVPNLSSPRAHPRLRALDLNHEKQKAQRRTHLETVGRLSRPAPAPVRHRPRCLFSSCAAQPSPRQAPPPPFG